MREPVQLDLLTRVELVTAYAGGNEERLPRGRWLDMPATEYLKHRPSSDYIVSERYL
jgi:hypothetical protein